MRGDFRCLLDVVLRVSEKSCQPVQPQPTERHPSLRRWPSGRQETQWELRRAPVLAPADGLMKIFPGAHAFLLLQVRQEEE